MRKITYVKQTDLRDCGVSCLLAITKYYGGYATREYLREITKTTREGVSIYSLKEGSKVLGFEAVAVKGNILNMKLKVPFIAHVVKNNLGHFIVVMSIKEKSITIMDPSSGIKNITYDDWNNITTNVYLELKPVTKILKQEKTNSLKSLLVPIIKRYKILIIILFILSLIYTLTNVLISYQLKFFIELLDNRNINILKTIFIFLILVNILKELSNLFKNNLLNYVNHTLDKTLFKDVYNHIIKLPYLYFKNRTKGDITTRIQDVFTIRDFISNLIVLITSLVLMITTFIFMLKINVKLTIVCLILTIVYISVIYLYNNYLSKKIKELKDEEIIVNNHIIESVSSINTIKSMQIENKLTDSLLSKYKLLQDVSFDLYQKNNQSNFFKNLIYGFCLLIIIYLGIKEVLNNNLSLSSLLVYHSLLSFYFEPIQNLASISMTFKEASVSFIRINELFSVKEELIEPDNKTINHHLKGNIKINNLIYSYNGVENIIKCNNLDIKEGNKVLVYGKSGCGKSTLMKLLVKYIKDYSGSILIDDRDLMTYNIFDIRRKITFVSQQEVLYTDTIYNNIVLDNNISYPEYLEIIKLTGVDNIIKRSILKDDMLIENNGSNLSGGEAQRIILARSLCKKSDIYIFDESLSAIDIQSERKIMKNLFSYLNNKTVIVISHRFNNRDLYQQFVCMQKGVVYDY